MIRKHFQYRSTITTILAKQRSEIKAAEEAMIRARQEVEEVISQDDFFKTTFDPYRPPDIDLPEAPQRMVSASESAGVGPMAAVAGTIAWAGVEAMQEHGAEFGVIDNGGDIALISDRELFIGIYAGQSELSGNMAFRLPPQERVLGICTSSATVGPSISFGCADAVTVFSHDVSLADAWATSLCNRASVCEDTLFSPLENTAVEGAFIIINDEVWGWGQVPEVIEAQVDEGLITAGR